MVWMGVCEKLILIEHLLLICVKCSAGCFIFTSLVRTTQWGEYYVNFAAKNVEVEWSTRGFLVAQSVRNPPAKDSNPVLGRSPGKGNGNPLQYSWLGNPMDRGTWQATVHGVTRVWHNLVTKPPQEEEGLRVSESHSLIAYNCPTVLFKTDFVFLGSKITADGNCSHEIKNAWSLEGKLWQT